MEDNKNMYDESMMDFILKIETIKKEMMLKKNSKYYNFTNKIQVSGNDEIEKLISFLHERIHYFLSNLPICIIQADFINLFNYLKFFYVKQKEELFKQDENYLKYKDGMDKGKYMMSYTHKLDLILASDSSFVEYCEFCIGIFDIYIELQYANEIINEGLATYYSLNAQPNSLLFDLMNIPNVIQLAIETGTSYNAILQKQKEMKSKILSSNGLYKNYYLYTEFLSKSYGDNLLFFLLKTIFTNSDIYNYDLINYNSQERSEIIQKMYSYDSMYINLAVKIEEIKSILNKQDEFNSSNKIQLYSVITGLDEIPQNTYDDEELIRKLDKLFFKHPYVVAAIEKLLKRKITEEDYTLAKVFMAAQYSGYHLYNLLTGEESQINDISEFIETIHSDALIINKYEKFAEKSLNDCVVGMNEIIRLSNSNKILKSGGKRNG